MLGLVKVLAFFMIVINMEKQQKKQIMKYIYFLAIGFVMGFICGTINSAHYNNIKHNKHIEYETDTATSVDGWYGNFEYVELTDSLQH